jgi:hypothetical protein
MATAMGASGDDALPWRSERAACHPQAHLPSPSHMPLRHHKARAPQPVNRTRHVAQAMWRQRPLPHRPPGGSPTSVVSLTSSVRTLRMYAAYLCSHAIHLPEVVANAPRQLRQSIGSEVLPESDCEDDRASCSGQPSPDGSLKARECEDSFGLLSPPSSQPSPRAYLAHATAVRPPSHESAALSSRSCSRNTNSGSGSGSGGSSDTIPMFRRLAHHAWTCPRSQPDTGH